MAKIKKFQIRMPKKGKIKKKNGKNEKFLMAKMKFSG